MKVVRFRSWNLNADKFQDTVNFYRNILGAEDRSFNQVNGVDVSRVMLGNMVVGVFDAEGGPSPGVPHHTFDIEGPADAQDAVKELEGMGIEVQGSAGASRRRRLLHLRERPGREPAGAFYQPSANLDEDIKSETHPEGGRT